MQILQHTPQQNVPIKPLKFVTRRTDDLEPEQKEAQDQHFPLKAALAYDKYIVGVKNNPNEWSWQFILNDKTMSTFDCSVLQDFEDFENECVTTLIKPEGSAVHKIEVQYASKTTVTLTGLRLLDKLGNKLLVAGLIESPSH